MNLKVGKFDGNRQVIWDASSFGSFHRCPRYYEYSTVRGWQPRYQATATVFGTALHACLEIFDHSLQRGDKRTAATELAVREALRRGPDLPGGDTARTPETLARAVVWYSDQFRNDPLKQALMPNGEAAVEVRFEGAIPGTNSRISGYIDKLVWLADGLYVLDRKTTKVTLGPRYFGYFEPDTQLTTYVWALRRLLGVPVQGAIIEAFQTAVSFTRCERSVFSITDEHLDEFEKEMVHYVEQAEHFHKTGYWPMNTASCGNYGGCRYREICSRSPDRREFWLKDSFDLRPRHHGSTEAAK